MDTPSLKDIVRPRKMNTSSIQDTLKLVVVGSTVETARRVSASSWNDFIDSFFVTSDFSKDDYPYDWITHWLAKQPAYRGSQIKITRALDGGGEDDNALAQDGKSNSSQESPDRDIKSNITANGSKKGLVPDYLAKIKDGCRKVFRSGKSEWMHESKPPPAKSKQFRRQKITIVVNAQQKNCGNVTHVQTENSHNDSSRVEMNTGNTHNTNSGSGTFNNVMPSDPVVSPPLEDPPIEHFYDTPLPPPPQESQDIPYEGPLYWVVYVWSWVPCFSWDGWFSRFCGWAPQLVPQVFSRLVHS